MIDIIDNVDCDSSLSKRLRNGQEVPGRLAI